MVIKNLIRVLIILGLFICISWYGKYNYILEEDCECDRTEYKITIAEARRVLVGPIDTSATYYYLKVKNKTYSRTIIPLVYKKESEYITKNYYHKK